MANAIRRLAMGTCIAGVGLAPLAIVRRASGATLLAPVYHVIADQAPAHVRHLFAVRNPRTFSDDLDFFLRTCTPVTLDQIHAHVQGREPLPRRPLFLSFDDGMREVADVIAPMLVRRGVPATFFLNSAFVDNKSLFYRHKASLLCDLAGKLSSTQLASLREPLAALGIEGTDLPQIVRSILAIPYAQRQLLDQLAAMLDLDCERFLRDQRPYLDSKQIKSLLEQGFSIGAHSVDHPRYATIALDEQLRQTRESTSFLMERFGITTRDLAFPFVSDGVGADFYEAAYTTEHLDALFCLGGIATDHPRNVERFWMESDATTPAATIVKRFYIQRWRSRRHRQGAGAR